jgi:hypothetical protein
VAPRRPLLFIAVDTEVTGNMHSPSLFRATRALCVFACIALVGLSQPAHAAVAAARPEPTVAPAVVGRYTAARASSVTLMQTQYFKVTRGFTTYTVYISRVGRRKMYDALKSMHSAGRDAIVAAASQACGKFGRVWAAALCGAVAGTFGRVVVDRVVESTRQAACLKIKGFNPAFPAGGPFPIIEFSVVPRSSKYCKTRY